MRRYSSGVTFCLIDIIFYYSSCTVDIRFYEKIASVVLFFIVTNNSLSLYMFVCLSLFYYIFFHQTITTSDLRRSARDGKEGREGGRDEKEGRDGKKIVGTIY